MSAEERAELIALRREAAELRAALVQIEVRLREDTEPLRRCIAKHGDDEAKRSWRAVYGSAVRAQVALSGPQDLPTPITELVERYESEDCNFSNPEWVRSVALRYVETMPDSQVRCLLYVLASSADAEARIAAAVAAERERWRQSIEAKAAEAERRFPLNGSPPLWLRSVEPKS